MDPNHEITAWIDDRLADTGARRRGPVREVRNWVRALVLTVETDRGRCWVKVVPDVFSHEVAVTELLADVDPGIVPPVVAHSSMSTTSSLPSSSRRRASLL